MAYGHLHIGQGGEKFLQISLNFIYPSRLLTKLFNGLFNGARLIDLRFQ